MHSDHYSCDIEVWYSSFIWWGIFSRLKIKWKKQANKIIQLHIFLVLPVANPVNRNSDSVLPATTAGNKSSDLGNFGCYCLILSHSEPCRLVFDTDFMFSGHDLTLALSMELLSKWFSLWCHFTLFSNKFGDQSLSWWCNTWMMNNVTTLSSGPSGLSLIPFLALFSL